VLWAACCTGSTVGSSGQQVGVKPGLPAAIDRRGGLYSGVNIEAPATAGLDGRTELEVMGSVLDVGE